MFTAPPPPSGPQGPAPPGAGPAPPGVAVDSEFFTGIVRGVLTSMMGPLGQGQGDTESIAQFIQRLSQSSNLFTFSEETSGGYAARLEAGPRMGPFYHDHLLPLVISFSPSFLLSHRCRLTKTWACDGFARFTKYVRVAPNEEVTGTSVSSRTF